MLQDLPSEVLQQIVGHLPTASSIINLACSCLRLYELVSADNYAIFRSFVQRKFPSIQTNTAWKEAACTLTSRSRAWDRRAFVARECYDHQGLDSADPINRTQKFGFVPVIDSYEIWPGGSLSSRKEVLAWSVAGRLRVRSSENGNISWSSWRTPEDHLPINDILDIRLLRPYQHESEEGEIVIIRRANGLVEKVKSGPDQNHYVEAANFVTNSQYLDCMDISMVQNPNLALCNTRRLKLYHVNEESKLIEPCASFKFDNDSKPHHRKRCVKYLSENNLAVCTQFVETRERAPIDIYDVNLRASRSTRLSPVRSFAPSSPFLAGRHGAITLAFLTDASGKPGHLFLSGWTDGIVRLHDTRSPEDAVASFVDHVDDGQISSLLAIGQERLLAGSHQNACLKVFDLRTANGRAYSYLDAGSHVEKDRPTHDIDTARKPRLSSIQAQRNINIFLAVDVKRSSTHWQPLVKPTSRQSDRYRGSIYSLSSPSSMSPTVYAGIQNHVIQLDFVSTDDVCRNVSHLNITNTGLEAGSKNEVLNLSCYERPREGYESTDTILLRKQDDWVENQDDSQKATVPLYHSETEEGWDERWRLARYDRSGTRRSSWRR